MSFTVSSSVAFNRIYLLVNFDSQNVEWGFKIDKNLIFGTWNLSCCFSIFLSFRIRHFVDCNHTVTATVKSISINIHSSGIKAISFNWTAVCLCQWIKILFSYFYKNHALNRHLSPSELQRHWLFGFSYQQKSLKRYGSISFMNKILDNSSRLNDIREFLIKKANCLLSF